MILGWRGIVDKDGDVIAWPTVLMDHNAAFGVLPSMTSRDYRARWRQWDNEPGASIDFDPGASQEDIDKVQSWVDAAQGVVRSIPSSEATLTSIAKHPFATVELTPQQKERLREIAERAPQTQRAYCDLCLGCGRFVGTAHADDCSYSHHYLVKPIHARVAPV